MPIEVQAPSFAPDPAVPAHVVLVRPEIPQNTGSIARLCAGTGAWLHLVEPLGFRLEDKYLKRAGLDYWPGVRLSLWPSEDALLDALPWERVLAFSAAAQRIHWETAYPVSPVLVFGAESIGLGETWRQERSEHLVGLPTSEAIRSLNLAQAVALGLYEGLRQQKWRPS